MGNKLTDNIDRLHTTELGAIRIRKNLMLTAEDIVSWCREQILSPDAAHTRKGKNWYVTVGDAVITINATSMTIITAHISQQ